MDRIYDIVLIITCLSLGSICGFVLGLIYSKERNLIYRHKYTDKEIHNIKPILTNATSQTKKGYWRPVYQGDEIINYRCSKCEFGSTFGRSTYRMNYCPNCGDKKWI